MRGRLLPSSRLWFLWRDKHFVVLDDLKSTSEQKSAAARQLLLGVVVFLLRGPLGTCGLADSELAQTVEKIRKRGINIEAVLSAKEQSILLTLKAFEDLPNEIAVELEEVFRLMENKDGCGDFVDWMMTEYDRGNQTKKEAVVRAQGFSGIGTF